MAKFSKSDTGEGTPGKKTSLLEALAKKLPKLRVTIDTFGDDINDNYTERKGRKTTGKLDPVPEGAGAKPGRGVSGKSASQPFPKGRVSGRTGGSQPPKGSGFTPKF